ncbi:MAG: nickel insertion protein, partial [Desulfobulbales bacterium]|nr:nickel insertion protein [Desulfobulbales bacterium]
MSGGYQSAIAYADCFSGVSGDMFLGAMLDAGLELDLLQAELAKLDLEEFSLQCSKLQEQGISCTRLQIKPDKPDRRRNWRDIRSLIERSGLPEEIKEKSLRVFTCLAEAEAKIHGCPPD